MWYSWMHIYSLYCYYHFLDTSLPQSPFLPFFLPSTEPIPCYLLLNSVSVCAASRLVTTDSRHRDGRETPPGRGSARATHAWCLPTTVRPGLTSGYKRFLLPRLGDPRERTEEIVWLVRAVGRPGVEGDIGEEKDIIMCDFFFIFYSRFL